MTGSASTRRPRLRMNAAEFEAYVALLRSDPTPEDITTLRSWVVRMALQHGQRVFVVFPWLVSQIRDDGSS